MPKNQIKVAPVRRSSDSRQVCTRLGRVLCEAIWREAESRGLSANEWISRACAEALGRPDLAEVPRGKRGRPRKGQAAG